MKINDFFATRLRAPLYNHVWSWGARVTSANRIFLRVDRRSIDEYDDGKTWVVIYDNNWGPSAGHKERLEHIDDILNGMEGFAVVADFNERGKIASFDDETLVRIGNVTQEGATIYAEVLDTVTVDEVVGTRYIESQETSDIEETFKSHVSSTHRLALVDARIGQGRFRKNVLRLWSNRCAVTGVKTVELLRASHVKPWKISSNRERLDPYNGIPLVATLDSMFDGGFITFSQAGKLIISSHFSQADRAALKIPGSLRLSSRPTKATAQYFEFHAEYVFKQ